MTELDNTLPRDVSLQAPRIGTLATVKRVLSAYWHMGDSGKPSTQREAARQKQNNEQTKP